MNSKDKILLESKIKGNITEQELNNCLNAILSSKDISDASKCENTKLELAEICFNKETEKRITFNGSFVLLKENELLEVWCVNGIIDFLKDKTRIFNEITKIINNQSETHEVMDEFKNINNETIRKTFRTTFSKPTKEKVDLLTKEEVEEYIIGVIRGLKN